MIRLYGLGTIMMLKQLYPNFVCVYTNLVKPSGYMKDIACVHTVIDCSDVVELIVIIRSTLPSHFEYCVSFFYTDACFNTSIKACICIKKTRHNIDNIKGSRVHLWLCVSYQYIVITWISRYWLAFNLSASYSIQNLKHSYTTN